jgi:hypothetical protein
MLRTFIILVLFLAIVGVCSAVTLDDFLGGGLADVADVVFSVRSVGHDGHWYANFGYWAANSDRMMYGKGGGGLFKLNIRSGEVSTIFDAAGGSARDPYMHYDGEKMLFSYRKADSIYYHLYEINIDGTGLRQITGGEFDDLEGVYLPDGGILFCSSRCNRWVNCWHTQVAVLYRCDGDGSNIQALSSNIEQDNTPWPMPDGRVIYTRWEYVDRSRVRYHHLWTTNPDGTGQMVYYGNMHPATVMLDAKPIPGSDKIVCNFSPGHGRKEHAGRITIVSPRKGPDDKGSAKFVTKQPDFRDPYPMSADCFFVVQDSRLFVTNAKGEMVLLHKLSGKRKDFWIHEPRPISRQVRQREIPSRVEMDRSTGLVILADVNRGRNMGGVKRGEIKKLLVMETLAKPINHSGTMEPTSLGGTFTLPRILGTVDVEEDGSAYIELPALRSLFFVALDENDMSVKRMQSFTTVMPGEVTSCVGCHEHRTRPPVNPGAGSVAALKRRPSVIKPIAGVPEVFDFPRDIQPIVNKHCVKCHDYDKRKGGAILSADRSGIYSHAYVTLMSRPGLVSHGKDAYGNIAPRKIGSSASRLMEKINGKHHDVKLSKIERDFIRLWIESGAPYAGTYAALGTGMVRPPIENVVWKKRCDSCHARPNQVQTELFYNFSRPDKSLVLLSPLAKAAGGYGQCKTKDGRAVFADTKDADYIKLLEIVQGQKRQLDKRKRFDMKGFRPGPHYIREMKKYGILDKNLPENAEIDVYETDRAYWKSLWYKPSVSMD